MYITITDSNFEKEVLNHTGLVMIDFWAEWCGPCKQLSPIVEEIAKEMVDVVKIGKMNIDENPETPSKLGIRSIPTLMLYKDGVQIEEVKIGSLPKKAIVEWINSNK
ncbi:MAG: thioredoxin 1 [Candidatus Midichloriaceae bacterium]|jgi:thioredoxin 1